MTTLPIPVDDETAAAFEAARPQDRERFVQVAAAVLKATVRSGETSRAEKADAVRRAADALSASARANGWTEEMNEALLRGDYDDELR